MNGGQALAEMMQAHGVGPLFGMGGFQLLPFYEAMRALGLRHTLINDERCGCFAADAYARVTGRPGACDATLGPGATNLVTAMVESLNAGVPQIVIVGDAFARPMVRALDEAAGRLDVSCVLSIISSGTMWSVDGNAALLRHLPQATLLDSFGSSEAVGFGLSAMTSEGTVQTAKFQIGDDVKVFTHDGREVARGTGEIGMIARTGAIPDGYYKDPAKTGATFPVIGGVRWSMPGDYCTVEPDGTLTLLGRGSGCINTAGEKVYPEEVEEALKQHPDVEDALVVGLPDDTWGQAVTAVVELRAGAGLDEDALRRHVHARLAG